MLEELSYPNCGSCSYDGSRLEHFQSKTVIAVPDITIQNLRAARILWIWEDYLRALLMLPAVIQAVLLQTFVQPSQGSRYEASNMWEFPRIEGTFLLGPSNRDCSTLGSLWGSP